MNKRAWMSFTVLPFLLSTGGCSNQQRGDLSADPLPQARGCVSPPPFHEVQRGENLFRIGWQHCLRYQDIAVWNDLESADRIMAGQRLRLSPPQGGTIARRKAAQPKVATTSSAPSRPKPAAKVAAAAPPVRSQPAKTERKGWSWPAQGKVVSGFNPSVPGRNGIRISGQEGETVKAAYPGQIVYTGSSLPGYGTLIIVQHSGGLLSAYGYLGTLYVKEGDKVEKGQTIAELGAGNDERAALHFEIRKDGQPVNPLGYLPS